MVSSMTILRTWAFEKAESSRIETRVTNNVLRRMADSLAELLRILSRKLREEARIRWSPHYETFTAGQSPATCRLSLVFLFGLRPSRQCRVARNQPGPAFVRDIRPGPLDQHDQTISKSDQEKNMYKKPSQPGEIPRDMELPELGNGSRAPDSGQASFIQVMKILARLVF